MSAEEAQPIQHQLEVSTRAQPGEHTIHDPSAHPVIQLSVYVALGLRPSETFPKGLTQSRQRNARLR